MKRGRRQPDDDDFSWPIEEEDDANPQYVSVDDVNSTATIQQVQPVQLAELPKDPLELFFKTMYETVKEMPREEIFGVRRKIFETVCEAEERVHFKATEVPAPAQDD